MRLVSEAGTRPSNTRRSVPRLIPDHCVLTRMSPSFNSGSGASINSAWKARVIQSAVVDLVMRCSSHISSRPFSNTAELPEATRDRPGLPKRRPRAFRSSPKQYDACEPAVYKLRFTPALGRGHAQSGDLPQSARIAWHRSRIRWLELGQCSSFRLLRHRHTMNRLPI